MNHPLNTTQLCCLWLCPVRLQLQQTGRGAQYFTKKMAALEQTIAAAEEEAGGNQEVLEISLKRVSPRQRNYGD